MPLWAATLIAMAAIAGIVLLSFQIRRCEKKALWILLLVGLCLVVFAAGVYLILGMILLGSL